MRNVGAETAYAGTEKYCFGLWCDAPKQSGLGADLFVKQYTNLRLRKNHHRSISYSDRGNMTADWLRDTNRISSILLKIL